MLVISIISLVLAAVCNSIMDILQFKIFRSRFKNLNTLWWNPTVSWKNKWEPGKVGKERFPLSSTLLVFITDAWHFFQFLMTTFLVISIITFDYDLSTWYEYILAFVVYKIIWGVSFEITFQLLTKNE